MQGDDEVLITKLQINSSIKILALQWHVNFKTVQSEGKIRVSAFRISAGFLETHKGRKFTENQKNGNYRKASIKIR